MNSDIFIRRASPADINLLFEWVNDMEVRRNAINTKNISYEEHEKWFNEKILSENSSIFILVKNLTPVGQIRFDFNKEEGVWVISYSISLHNRGGGLGKVIVKMGIELFNRFPLWGYVKEDNKYSQAVFNAMGFTNEGLCSIGNCILVKFSKNSI